jgi:hypothetical protein
MDTKYLILFGGITLFVLIMFQVASGLKWIKVDYKWHRYAGIGTLIFALAHATIGYLFLFA